MCLSDGSPPVYEGASSPLTRHYRGYPWRPFRLSIFCCRKIHGPAGALMCALSGGVHEVGGIARSAYRSKGTFS